MRVKWHRDGKPEGHSNFVDLSPASESACPRSCYEEVKSDRNKEQQKLNKIKYFASIKRKNEKDVIKNLICLESQSFQINRADFYLYRNTILTTVEFSNIFLQTFNRKNVHLLTIECFLDVANSLNSSLMSLRCHLDVMTDYSLVVTSYDTFAAADLIILLASPRMTRLQKPISFRPT